MTDRALLAAQRVCVCVAAACFVGLAVVLYAY